MSSPDRVDHETVERILSTEPTRILDALPDSPGTQRAKELIGEVADLAHREVEAVEAGVEKAVPG